VPPRCGAERHTGLAFRLEVPPTEASWFSPPVASRALRLLDDKGHHGRQFRASIDRFNDWLSAFIRPREWRAVRTVFLLFGALAVVLGSFTLTLRLLYYWDPRSVPPPQQSLANPDNKSGSTAAQNAVLFTVSSGSNRQNWSVVTKATTTQIDKAGIIVNSRVFENQYELMTNEISTVPDQTYVVQYDIQVTEGAIALGVLDALGNKWITVQPVTQRKGSFPFRAPTRLTEIVIMNAGQPPTTATVAELLVRKE
jgi:hypothetical protein